MNVSVLPYPQARPRPAHKQVESVSRDSNTLRASVLDAALELGIGSNPLVADWMFNNAVIEEEGDENEVRMNFCGFWFDFIVFILCEDRCCTLWSTNSSAFLCEPMWSRTRSNEHRFWS